MASITQQISPLLTPDLFIQETMKCMEERLTKEIDQIQANIETQKQGVIAEAKKAFNKIKEDREKAVEDTDKFKTLKGKYEKIIVENEELRKAHINIRLRRFLSVSLVVAAVAAGIIGAAVGCAATAVISFSIAVILCPAIFINYATEATDLAEENIAKKKADQ